MTHEKSKLRKKQKHIIRLKREKEREALRKDVNLKTIYTGDRDTEIEAAFTKLIQQVRHQAAFRNIVNQCKKSKEREWRKRPEKILCALLFEMFPRIFKKKYFHTYRVHFYITILDAIYVEIRKNKLIKINDSLVIYRPDLQIEGKLIGFTKHLLNRVAERIGACVNDYFGYTDVFTLLYGEPTARYTIIRTRTKTLLQIWVRIYRVYNIHEFAKQLTGNEPTEATYVLLGYCPTVLQGNILLAKTLNPPGYCSTPERDWHERHHGVLKNKDVAEVCCFSHLRISHEFSLLKLFHDNGFTQVRDFST